MSIAISGSSITFPDQTQMSTATGGSFRNRIINGDMRVWQRGTTISNPTTTNFYTADRWGCNRAGDVTGATVSRDISGLSGFEYSLKLQRTAGNTSTASLSLWYSNESTNTYDLAGSPATLSFYAKTGANYSGGSLSVIIYSGTGTDQRVYNYTGLVSVAATNQAVTSTWTRYTLTGTVSANATEIGLQLSWIPTGTAGADDSVYITGVQLEAGSSATEFERRPIGTEIALCKRYYDKSYNISVAPATATRNGMVVINTEAWQNSWRAVGSAFKFSCEMRTAPPSITYYDGAGTSNRVTVLWNSATPVDGQNPTLAFDIGTSGVVTRQTGGVTNQGSIHVAHYTADAEL